MTISSNRALQLPPVVIALALAGGGVGGALGLAAPVGGPFIAAVAAALVHGLASLASP